MKKYTLAAIGLLSAALILAPAGKASADDWHHGGHEGWHHEGWHHEHEWHHGDDDDFATGLFGGLLGAFALAAAPPPPAPVYVAPPPQVVYAAPAPVYPAYSYYYPRHRVVYYGY